MRGEADAMICGVEGRYIEPPAARSRDRRILSRGG